MIHENLNLLAEDEVYKFAYIFVRVPFTTGSPGSPSRSSRAAKPPADSSCRAVLVNAPKPPDVHPGALLSEKVLPLMVS